jgi:hypothetical protein
MDGMNIKDIIGDIPLANPPTSEPPIKDSLDRARRIFRKGRYEWMNGTTVYIQDGSDSNNRTCMYPPAMSSSDPFVHGLGLDSQEQ